jgi:CheY-like chemotaxis protein
MEPPLDSSAARILFVEDHPDVREALASLLEDCGYGVVAVEDAERGLATLESGGRFDFVVTDHSLPGKNGAWLLQQAVAKGLIEAAQAVVVTALPDPPGCSGFTVMHKPLDVNNFLDEVERRLRHVSQVSANETTSAPVRLAFYMSSHSPISHRALQSLESALAGFDPRRYQLEICDLSTGSHELAEQDKVSYTPTLVKRGPGPRSWMVGDLRDQDRLAGVLTAWGVETKPSR